MPRYEYECRELGGDDSDWDKVRADARELAAERYAKKCELGSHETTEMDVEVRQPDSVDPGLITKFRVIVEWDPVYHAREIKDGG